MDATSSNLEPQGLADETNSNIRNLTTVLVDGTPTIVLPPSPESSNGSFSERNTEPQQQQKEIETDGSIHRISIPRLRKHLGVREDCQDKNEEDMIKDLVEKFNETRSDSDGQAAGKFEAVINATKESKLMTVSADNNFHVALFVSQTGSTPPILQWYDSNLKTGPIHTVWFFYRAREIFAITSGKGYLVVHDHSEFDFPNKIAGRLCSVDGCRSTAKKLLVGPACAESRVSKSSERPSVGDYPWLDSSFTTELRNDASVRQICNFGSQVVEFRSCSVRFSSKFEIPKWPRILDHLSSIAKDKVTYLNKSPEECGANEPAVMREENSTKVYNGYMVKTPPEVYTELQEALLRRFRLSFESKDWSDFTFDLGYKHYKDFALAAKFELQFKLPSDPQRKLPWVTLPMSPCFGDVIQHFNYYNKNYIPSNLKKEDKQYVADVLVKNTTLKYTKADGKTNQDSLLNFLEGQMIHNNKIFWRAQNLWLEPMDVFVAEADKSFTKFLQRHLSGQDMHLSKDWPTCVDSQSDDTDLVGAYVSKYEGSIGYFLPLPEEKALFDLMYVTSDGQIWMYFIAHNFSAHTVGLCVRIHKCFEQIKVACESTSEHQGGAFELFYNATSEEDRKLLGESFGRFQARLKESHIVYALAKSTTRGPSYHPTTLAEESDRPISITSEVLESRFDPTDTDLKVFLNGKSLQDDGIRKAGGKRMYSVLRNNGYIDANSGMFTAKFLYSDENTFSMDENHAHITDDRRKALYRFCTRFQSGFKSLRAKWELRYVALKVVHSTRFCIHEIEAEK